MNLKNPELFNKAKEFIGKEVITPSGNKTIINNIRSTNEMILAYIYDNTPMNIEILREAETGIYMDHFLKNLDKNN